LHLRTADNGVGLRENEEASNGLGLRNIESRVRLLNGMFTLFNRAEGGVMIEILFPYTTASPDPTHP
ncbi:MAG: histidine kinase, partial [Sphingobacteriia bacterium]